MRCVALLVASLAISSPGVAQFGRNACNTNWDNKGYFVSPFWAGNPVYDGRVTFARIKYRGNWACADQGPGWSHDYPRTETHFMQILQSLTNVHPFVRHGEIEGSTLLSWDDSTLFKYPIAYMSEPFGWELNASELAGFTRYIKRGGFVIFDDMGFRGTDHMGHLMQQWHRAFPQAIPIELKPTDVVFNIFFKINLALVPGFYSRDCGCPAKYYGIYQDNDPSKRLVAVINDHQDFGEYIEYSDQGFSIVPSNEAYKLMVNYFIYALSH